VLSAAAEIEVTDGERASRERARTPARRRAVETHRVSTRDLPRSLSGRTASFGKNARVGSGTGNGRVRLISASLRSVERNALARPIDDSRWDEGNYWAADDPANRVGDPPGYPQDDGAGSGNFQLAAPVISLPGRGLSLNLVLAYNSRVWTKAGSEIDFDADRGWPAPGWSLGFGKIVGMGAGGSMIIEPDGTRRAFTGALANYGSGYYYFNGHTTDGSLIDYWSWSYNGVISMAEARLPNGTLIRYGAAGDGCVYPTQIADVNGNYIRIAYVGNQGPRIQYITDSLGRAVEFHYDENGLLTAITGPGLNGAARTLVRLHYRQLALNYGFAGLTVRARNPLVWVVDAVYYPATGTGYWFGDPDSYSSYGMLAKVEEQRAMSFDASSLTEQGMIGTGQMTRRQVYNYPLGPDYSLTDAPTYTTLTETWAGMDAEPAVTQYAIYQNASPRRVEITRPDGTKSIQYSFNAPNQYNDGLIYRDELRDSQGSLLARSTVTWEQGTYDSPRPVRTEITDERGQVTATELSYGPVYNQVTETREYDYGGTNMRRVTRTAYENSTNYTNRHIFNLVRIVETYGGDGATRLSRVEYEYDGATLQDAPGVVQHLPSHNPYAPPVESCLWQDDPNDPDYQNPGCVGWDPRCDGYVEQIYVCNTLPQYDPATDYRGNVTQIKKYADAANLAGATTETRRYDIAGNMVAASTSCCEQTSWSYTVDTQYAYPQAQTRGAADPSGPRVTTSAVYDFNTGLVLATTDADGRTSQTIYDANTLRPQTSYASSGAYTSYAYDDTAMVVGETTRTADGTLASQSVRRLNGLGQIKREEALATGGAWDVVETQYDELGRIRRQTRPYRAGQEQPQWNETQYDALGRVVSVRAPDGSQTRVFYNEVQRPDVASGEPGQTERHVDAWGRERWLRTDADGRLVEVVEPNPQGDGSVWTGGLVTRYIYDPLGNLIETIQGAQRRRFRYDSLGRLTHQKLAEQSATLDDAGRYVGGGSWGEVFAYDDRSNLIWRVDARGVRIVFDYNGDPLNRLQSVTYDTSGAGQPVEPAATVRYEYVTAGDLTRVKRIVAEGVSTEEYEYDAEGRISRKRVVLATRPNHPFDVEYIYDTLDRVTDVRYPAQYGFGAALRKVVHHDYDVASRLRGLKVDGVDYASNLQYNAASQTTSLQVGTGANQVIETYNYDAATGLLTNQQVTRGAVRLLDLSYDYLRPGTSAGRTGQLTRVINNLDRSKDKTYEYDALGRLVRVTSGDNRWWQQYTYDRYGNRTSVAVGGQLARQIEEPSSDVARLAGAGDQPSTAQRERARAFGWQRPDPKVVLPTELLAWRLDPLGEFNPWRVVNDSPFSLFTGREAADPAAAINVSAPPPQYNGYFDGADCNQLWGWAWDASQPTTPIQVDLFVDGNFLARVVADQYRSDLQSAGIGDGQHGWSYALPESLRDRQAHTISARVADSTFELSNSPRQLQCAPSRSAVVARDGHAQLSYDETSNRISSAGWEYDAAGNQIRVQTAGGGWQRMEYDGAGRLIRVRDDGGAVLASYVYGATNERLASQEGEVRTYYVWSGSGVIAEYVEVGGARQPVWTKQQFYLGGRLLATSQPADGGERVEYTHPDRLGTRLVRQDRGGAYYEQETLPYGVALEGEGSGGGSRRFTSYERSWVTGLDYAINRHYDSLQGRFTQVDPIGMKSVDLKNPQTLNLYAYVQNDPVNYTDPTGLDLMSEPHWTDICFSAAYSGCGSGRDMAMFAIDFGMRQTFGYAYYDLPGYANEAEQGMYRYESMLYTGFDPAFGIFRGTVQIIATQGGTTTTQTLQNPTPQEVTRAYLTAAGLMQYIVAGTMRDRGTGLTFRFDKQFQKEIFAILNNTAIFLSGVFGWLHKKDVGATRLRDILDYRSITGTLGERSLQVVVHRTTLRGYADTDRFNPYQDVRGFLGHTFLELIPNRLRRIFGGGQK